MGAPPRGQVGAPSLGAFLQEGRLLQDRELPEQPRVGGGGVSSGARAVCPGSAFQSQSCLGLGHTR